MPDAKSEKVKIFISYARDDAEQVSEIYHRLKAAGFDPWIDTEHLLPGVRWRDTIEKALREADFFLLCLSAQSKDRRGFIQREIKTALDLWKERMHDDIYFIPLRLEECELPEKVEDFQCVNWFEPGAWEKLEKALRIQAEKLRGKKVPKPKPASPLKPPSFTPHSNPISLLARYKTAILAVCVLGLARYKTAILAVCVLGLVVFVIFGFGYIITYQPFSAPQYALTPTPIAEKSFPSGDYAEVLL